MQLIPAISIRKKRVVITEEGEYLPVGEPIEVLRALEKEGYELFYIMDMDGVEKNRMQIPVIERIAAEFRIWLDGGFRTVGDVEDALVLGAEMAVISSKNIRSMEDVRRAHELSDNLIFSADYFEGILKWGNVPDNLEDMAEELGEIGLKRVIFTVLGKDAPVDNVIELFSKDFQLWLGGNIDIERYEGDERIEGLIIPYSRLMGKMEK